MDIGYTKELENIQVDGKLENIRRVADTLTIGKLKITRVKCYGRTSSRNPNIPLVLFEIKGLTETLNHNELLEEQDFKRFCRVALDLLK